MLVIAVDTATPAVTAGIVELPAEGPAVTLSRRATIDARSHCELLMPHVLECCAEARVSLSDCQAVVVGCGPGPFTGLRVGMSTAAALGDALGIPVYGVCTLDAIAVAAWEEVRTAQLAERTQQDENVLAAQKLLVVTDARRREVYWATYSLQGLLVEGLRADQEDPMEILSWAVPQRLDGSAVNKPQDISVTRVACVAGTRKYRSSFLCPHVDVEYPSPAALVTVARQKIIEGVEPEPIRPLYLRRPDAVPPRPRPVSAAITGLSQNE